MKSVTAFIGSPRKSGFTHAATRQLLDDLQSLGDVRSEIVFLAERDLRPCRGCCACFVRGEEHCPLDDDRDLLMEKMMASDGVVFASPTYSFHVPAVMKTLLDRLGFVFHRPRFFGKAFTSIAVQGIYGGQDVSRYLDFVGGGLGFNVVKGSCITALDPMTEAERRKIAAVLARQSRRFHEQLSNPGLPAPSLFQLWAFRMARTRIGLELGPDNRDHVHYRDHGWLDSDYYYPTPLGPLDRAAGAAFDWLAARTARTRVRTTVR